MHFNKRVTKATFLYVISIYLFNISQHWEHKIDTFSQNPQNTLTRNILERHVKDHSLLADVSFLVNVSLKAFKKMLRVTQED